MTLAFDVGGCSVLVEPSDQGRKPQPVTAHNRHHVRGDISTGGRRRAFGDSGEPEEKLVSFPQRFCNWSTC